MLFLINALIAILSKTKQQTLRQEGVHAEHIVTLSEQIVTHLSEHTG